MERNTSKKYKTEGRMELQKMVQKDITINV